MMEANFFKECNTVSIGGGKFVMNNAPDSSQRTITHHRNNIVNDRSRRITNYGGYTNFGQHADGNGQINNYGGQTTNNGPVYGYRPHYPPVMNKWTPTFPDDDNLNDDFQPPLPAWGNQPYQQPDRLSPGDRDYYGRNHPASQSEPQFGRKWTKAPGFPRTQTEQPSRATNKFDIHSPQFRKEYESLSAEMKAYVQGLGFDPQDSLNEGMANVTLDDSRTSRSPESHERRTPDVHPKGKNAAYRPARFDDEEDEEEDEDEDDYDGGQHQQYSSLYTHNDNRVITKHINSHNVNTENTVDSFNDNSTRTNINKNAR